MLLQSWDSVVVLCFVVRYLMSILVLQFAFLVSRDCCGALPGGAMGLSAVCDCGIS